MSGVCRRPQEGNAAAAGGSDAELARGINREITAAARSGSCSALMHALEYRVHQLNLINLSTALHRLAKLSPPHGADCRPGILASSTVEAMLQQARGHAKDLCRQSPAGARGGKGRARGAETDSASEMRCMSVICWSLGSLRLGDEPIFEHMANIPARRWRELKPFELSNILWAMAKLGVKQQHRLLKSVTPDLLARETSEFSPQCMSTVCWAFGTAMVNQTELFNRFGRGVVQNTHKLTPQSVSTLLWSFARVRRQDKMVFQRLGDFCADAGADAHFMRSFKFQELANVVWAYATLRLVHSRLFECIADVLSESEGPVPPHNSANLVWAYAKCESPCCGRLIPPLLAGLARQLHCLKPQELAAILWGVSRSPPSCRRACQDSLEAMMGHMVKQLHAFPPQALACSAEALSALGSRGAFSSQVRHASLSKLDTFQPASVCTLLRVVAEDLGQRPQSADLRWQLKKIASQVHGSLHEFKAHNLAHLRETALKLPQRSLCDVLPDAALVDLPRGVEPDAGEPCLPDEDALDFGGWSSDDGAARAEGTAAASSGSAPMALEASAGGRGRRRRPDQRRGSLAEERRGGEGRHPDAGASGKTQQVVRKLLEAAIAADPLPQSLAPAEALPVWLSTKVWPPSGASGLAALSGSMLTIRTTFLTVETHRSLSSSASTPALLPSQESGVSSPEMPAPTASPSSARRPPEESGMSELLADKGLCLQAAWERLRSEVPALPRCEEVLLKAGQTQQCEWSAAKAAGWLLHSSWVDREVGLGVALILQQLWKYHQKAMAQCPVCSRCFERDGGCPSATRSRDADGIAAAEARSSVDNEVCVECAA